MANRDMNAKDKIRPVGHRPGEPLADFLSGSSEAFEFALGLDSSRPEALHSRAVSLRRLRQFEKAQAVLDEALKLHGRDVRLLKEQVVLLCARKLFDRALATLDRMLAREPENALVWEWKAATLCAQGRLAEADEVVQAALGQFPDHAGLLAERGYLCFAQGQFEPAVEWFDRALGLNDRDEVAWQWKVAALRRLGRLAEAEAVLERVIARFPRNAGLRVERGLLNYDRRQYGAAVEAFDQALLRDRGNEEAWQWKITVLRLQQRYAETAQLIEETLARFPQNAAILAERGYLHFDQQEYSRAVAALDRAVAVEPEFEEAWQWKVAALRLQGRIQEAQRALASAEKMFPGSPGLSHERQQLEQA
jgi:tetratricopeptide (TPR) repeat protein